MTRSTRASRSASRSSETLQAASRASTGPARASARVELLDGGRHPRSRAAAVGLPAPAVRRHEPARDDRHGDRLRPEAADRRRADHRARRHHPGADPRPAAAAAGETGMGLVLITHDMGVVAETADRVVVQYAGQQVEQQDDARPVRRSAPSLHRGAARGAARARDGAHAALDPRRRARPVRPAGGLPVLAALRLRDRPLPQGAAAACSPELGRALCHYPLVQGQPTNRERRMSASSASSSKAATSRATTRASAACSRRRATVKALDGRVVRPRDAARRWPWSANPAAASRRSRGSSRMIEAPTSGSCRSTASTSSTSRRPRSARKLRARGADRVPEPLWLAQPAPEDRRRAGGAAARQHRHAGRASAARRAADMMARVGLRPRAFITAIRTCSPAASASASPSPAP